MVLSTEMPCEGFLFLTVTASSSWQQEKKQVIYPWLLTKVRLQISTSREATEKNTVLYCILRPNHRHRFSAEAKPDREYI